jgi:nuclear transport factor 2 (NTF2) superfamily protein
MTTDAIDPELTGADRVRAVFDRVRDGDERVADLYAEDGVVWAGGHEIRGRDAIRAFYRRTIDAIHPRPEVREVLESAGLFIAVVHVPTDRGVQDAVDLFELGEGGIRRLVIFSRA